MSKSYFFYHECVYTHRDFYTFTHSPVTFHSSFFSVSLPRRLSKGQGLQHAQLPGTIPEPQTWSSAWAEGGEQLLTAPACPAEPSRTCAPAPHCPFHHSCPSCFSTKVTLPIALERDQFLTFLFLALSHTLVMLIEVQTCTADLAQAKNQNSPGLVPGCTKVLKWFGLVQHFITCLWRICQTSKSHHQSASHVQTNRCNLYCHQDRLEERTNGAKPSFYYFKTSFDLWTKLIKTVHNFPTLVNCFSMQLSHS